MKRAIKNKTNVYQYLDSCGVLESGTGDDIELARKKYWREYKIKWKKEKQKESKSVEIVFSLNEFNTITREAKRCHTNPTNYIRKSTLANNHRIIDQVAVGQLRELAVSHHNTLRNLVEENGLSEQIGNQLLNQASQLEKRVLDFFESFK